MRPFSTTVIGMCSALLLAGCHHAARVEPEPPLAVFDAEVFPAVARWADSMHRPGPVVFDPRPTDQWAGPYSALARLSRSAVSRMQARRQAILNELRYASRIEQNLEKNCASKLFPSVSNAGDRAIRRGCPTTNFTYVVVGPPSRGPGAPTLGGEPRTVVSDSAYVKLSAEAIGPGGWALYAYDVVLGRSASGWKVVRIAMASIAE